ncbi:hypothetical protein LWI29_015906 [Acer saccharum]|uniref:C-JID domain-containing protein n=1 Tax=Acer saccharum TaxID=4024 RepID=A0AA39SWU8_ACESA|nr:hypothetical protein LWI29_015906 [Acer saccharum]
MKVLRFTLNKALLIGNKGAEEVEGISLNMDYLKDGHLNLSCQVFDKMTNLRLLLFTYGYYSLSKFCDTALYKVHLPNGLNSLPDELISLQWHSYPLRALPSNFSPEKLVKLDLSHSNIEQLWEGTKLAPKLKWLVLRHCQHLTRIPNLSDFLSLEEVDLTGCKSLVEFPSSIQQLKKLRYLTLGGCCNVTKFPLTSASIESLDLRETEIEEVPSSIQSLTNLTKLDLTRCRRLKRISASIFKLKSVHSLKLDDCSELETFPEISETMEILNSLDTRSRWRCDLHRKQLCQLCPPHYEYVKFLFINCFNLDQKAVSNVFEESLKGSEEPPTRFSICLPGTEIPEWFTYQSPGSSINIRVLRQDLVNSKFMGFALCAVLWIEEYHGYPDDLAVGIYCHFDTCLDCIYFIPSDDTTDEPVLILNLNHILLGYYSFSKFLSSCQNLEMLIANDSDYVDIPFDFISRLAVKYCAVHPIYTKPIEIISATIEDIGVTSLKRSGRSNDNEEEVEPHPKRIFTQPN